MKLFEPVASQQHVCVYRLQSKLKVCKSVRLIIHHGMLRVILIQALTATLVTPPAASKHSAWPTLGAHRSTTVYLNSTAG